MTRHRSLLSLACLCALLIFVSPPARAYHEAGTQAQYDAPDEVTLELDMVNCIVEHLRGDPRLPQENDNTDGDLFITAAGACEPAVWAWRRAYAQTYATETGALRHLGVSFINWTLRKARETGHTAAH